MKMPLLILALMVLTNCSGVREVSIHKSSNDFSLWVYRRTGNIYIVGHGGFFIREESRYVIIIPENKGVIPFDKLNIEKEGKKINVNSGSIKFIDRRHITIYLRQEVEGKTVDMEINGTFKID